MQGGGPPKYLEGVPAEVQMAREAALLGDYDGALTRFAAVRKALQKHIGAVAGSEEEPRWRQALQDINGEVKLIQELVKALELFKYPPGSGSGAAVSGPPMPLDGTDDVDIDFGAGSPGRNPFGAAAPAWGPRGPPFQGAHAHGHAHRSSPALAPTAHNGPAAWERPAPASGHAHAQHRSAASAGAGPSHHHHHRTPAGRAAAASSSASASSTPAVGPRSYPGGAGPRSASAAAASGAGGGSSSASKGAGAKSGSKPPVPKQAAPGPAKGAGGAPAKGPKDRPSFSDAHPGAVDAEVSQS